MTQRAWAMLKEANIDALIAADDLTGAAKSLRGSVTLVWSVGSGYHRTLGAT